MVLHGVSLKPSPCDNAYQHVTRLKTYETGVNQSTHDFIASRAGSGCRHDPSAEILVLDCPIHGGSLFGKQLRLPHNPIVKKSRVKSTKMP